MCVSPRPRDMFIILHGQIWIYMDRNSILEKVGLRASSISKPNSYHEGQRFVSRAQVLVHDLLSVPEFRCGRSNTLMESSQR